MRSLTLAAMIAAVIAALSAPAATAQDAGVRAESGAAAATTRSDPFSAEEILDATTPPLTQAERRFLPAQTVPAKFPTLVLRGVGSSANVSDKTAILEIDGVGAFIVREGDLLSLQSIPGENVIRIKRISDISVTVEAGSFGEIIVVR